MTAAGLFQLRTRFTCCVLDETRWPRYFTAPRTNDAREAIRAALHNERVAKIVMMHTGNGVDPLGRMLLEDGVDVWLAPQQLLDDIAQLLRRPRQQCGPRTRAAIFARMGSAPTWLAMLNPLSTNRQSPAQLPIF